MKAEYLCVDFSLSSDADLYKKIWEHVSGKDIGILGLFYPPFYSVFDIYVFVDYGSLSI